MIFPIFILSAILGLSYSIPFENKSAATGEVLKSSKIFSKTLPQENRQTHGNRTSGPTEHHEMKLFAADTKDYILLRDYRGKVIIIGIDPYQEIISYSLPEISKCISAIVKDTFYNIDTLNGIILSTNVENLLQGPDNINWTLVGVFPEEDNYILYGSAVDGSIIYFSTFYGNLYSYDTRYKITFKVGYIGVNVYYASLAVVQNVLYMHRYNSFYSFNGTSVKSVETPDTREYAGLFQQGDDVCIIGGNLTDVYPDPVHCYNPSNQIWSTRSHINYARRNPGVVTIGSRTYAFGGFATFRDGSTSTFWRNSVEVLDHETNRWGFVPTPLSDDQQYIQALAFKF